jgi:mRNA interferase MazF
MCPVTTKVKGYPFEIPVPDGLPVSGVVLSDQVRSLDWRAHNTEFVCAAPSECTEGAARALAKLLPR